MMQKIIATISTMLLSMVMFLTSIGSANAMPLVPVQSTTIASIYVGNLSYEVTQEDLNEVFADYGSVKRVHLPTDRETGRPRGFGFVEMSTEEEEAAAIEALDGAEWMGREIKVNKAKPRESSKPACCGYNRRGVNFI